MAADLILLCRTWISEDQETCLEEEQSGFIADVGFETYQRILNEAMTELRDAEFRETPLSEENVEGYNKPVQKKTYVSDFQIDTDLEIMFPDEYVSNISERIRLYKELNEIDTEETLCSFEKRLIDRFGNLPQPAQALLDIVRIKWIAVKIGIEKILLKNDLLIANFVSDPNSQVLQKCALCFNYELRKQKAKTDECETKSFETQPHDQ